MQATREFAETRKLALAANDLVTLVEHRWVGLTLQNKTLTTQRAFCPDERLRKEFQLSPWKQLALFGYVLEPWLSSGTSCMYEMDVFSRDLRQMNIRNLFQARDVNKQNFLPLQTHLRLEPCLFYVLVTKPSLSAAWSCASGGARTRGRWSWAGFLQASPCQHCHPLLPLRSASPLGPTLFPAHLTSHPQ